MVHKARLLEDGDLDVLEMYEGVNNGEELFIDNDDIIESMRL